MDRKPTPILDLLGVLLAGWLMFGGGLSLPSFPSISTKPTAVTYVHDEKAVLPSGVMAALSELNNQGIVATALPDDSVDGDGKVPKQYEATLPAAKACGIPSLVVQSGERVLRTVKDPKTKAEVLEAAR